MVAFLKEKYGDNTLVIFTSDNGPETFMRYSRAKHSYGTPGELKGMKLWTNEAGFRVPCIVNWLGKETFTGTSEKVVSALDFLPTFVDIAGAELPKRTLDGQSIKKFLSTGDLEREKPLIWAFYDAINERRVAMRSGDWKIMARLESDNKVLPNIHNLYDGNEAYVKNAELTNFVLFNLKNDISESEDLASKEPAVFEKMKAEF
ncbi:sulfatase [Algibacter lectus]|uniref:Sulfatase n=1 Tax=Algibacter lectus TaxID=221126 RepID=A0A090WPG9_9FLAO|nr:sulfatase-like hydrolase/transferase [Algibacter lectus]GAL78103.1 sulfatase [Algibacter lectus]